MSARAANAYKRVDLESAPKNQILDRLFERFGADVAQAKAAMAAGKIQDRANAIDHALRIVAELVASLDHTTAPELCANLASLYDYVAASLSEGNISNKPEPLDRAAKVMAQLAGAFREAGQR
jgi:flagellar secretion chaperone FliS